MSQKQEIKNAIDDATSLTKNLIAFEQNMWNPGMFHVDALINDIPTRIGYVHFSRLVNFVMGARCVLDTSEHKVLDTVVKAN